jgi:mannose-6-phosphate isomerase-like protein (cupin superfamily)/CDGSH-type Zn-finger protein
MKPCLVTLEAGRTYYWCACGRSTRQPFCDGSHQGTPFVPRKLVAERDEEVLLCGCKRTCDAPFCDGAHTNLPGGSPLDDPESPANRDIPLILRGDDARSWLDGGCYVTSPQLEPKTVRGNLRYGYPVTAELGAQFQSQALLEVEGGASPVLSFGKREVILFIIEGSGCVIVSGREFAVEANHGLYVRTGEALQCVPAGGRMLRVCALASPPGVLEWPSTMSRNFDDTVPARVAGIDARERVAMGPRYFQVLIDKRLGSRVLTQFIGHIPRSKAAPHRHLYEETLIVLSGAGHIWSETRKAAVAVGDVIFLPRKQLHSLEATSADGMRVVGVICPGDNPRISY